jgi:hypothetical protein
VRGRHESAGAPRANRCAVSCGRSSNRRR